MTSAQDQHRNAPAPQGDGDAPDSPAAARDQQTDSGEMMRKHRTSTLWMYFANIILGLWLMVSPAVAAYHDTALARSDLLTGAAIVALGIVALFPKGDFWGRWGICLAGIWLLLAPLVFWAPTAYVYANDTLVGGLVIALAVLAPMMPGTAHHMAMMQPGPQTPPGWSYNPSSWWQRGIIIALGVISFFISRYMAAYQLGHIDSVWDPLFHPGTPKVLTSDVSKAWPVSDSGLGSVSYLLEALSGFMGGASRWRTMPWMVLMFGVLVVPLGITSIVLVIMQPVMVGTWCTLCLVTALFMLVMIPLALDEIWAMIQFMLRIRREGRPFWRTFWVGGTVDGGSEDERAPRWEGPDPKTLPAMVWGVTVPPTLIASAVIGLWLMAAPPILGSDGTVANSDFLVGPLVAVVAVIAMAEVARPARFINVAFGLWLLAAPFFLGGATTGSTVSDVVAGLALIALSVPRGSVRERYAGWQRFIV